MVVGDNDSVGQDSATGAGDGLFWGILKICGEPAEAYPTITSTAEAADLVVVGRISGVRPGKMTSLGDDGGPFFALANLTVEPRETLKGESQGALVVSLALGDFENCAHLASVISALRGARPDQEVLLLLREKPNGMTSAPYRLINANALWIQSSADALENPIEACHELEAGFLEGISDFEDLLSRLSASLGT